MSFGSRPLLESSAGTTTGKNADFSRIADGDTLIIKVDGDDSVTITFSDTDKNIKAIIRKINDRAGKSIAAESTAIDSKGQLELTSTSVLILHPPPKKPGEKEKLLTPDELQKSQVVVSGSSCVLAKIGLTAGIYTAHYAWNGQFFGLNIIGNVITSVFARWAIEFPSTTGSVGIVVSGNLITGECYKRDVATGKCLDDPKALAAIVSRSHFNTVISGNSCVGVFEGMDYADYGGLFSDNNSFSGQDREGHQFLGDLRFDIRKMNDASIIDSHSYTHLIDTTKERLTFTLPDHKAGRRLLFKNVGPQTAILKPKNSERIDRSMDIYELHPSDFVELADDGKRYWIIRR